MCVVFESRFRIRMQARPLDRPARHTTSDGSSSDSDGEVNPDLPALNALDIPDVERVANAAADLILGAF